jgi:pimeloyl-ACP methyl ester carboxylesterase
MKGRTRRAGLFAALAFLVLLVRPASHHVRASAMLLAFADAGAEVPCDEEAISLAVPPGRVVRARTFAPKGEALSDVPALVLVHGVQHEGIDEPRFQRFARALVRAGVAVLTPQVDELADYHVAPASIDTVGAAVEALRERSGHAKVGLVGVSFGGGVSLLAAADPRFASHVSFVVSIGAHDDLARVSRFFATNEIPSAAGPIEHLHAHEYGGVILVYTHAEAFFPPADVPAAREALRLWIWEKRDEARAAAAPLSPASRAKVEALFRADIASVRTELLAQIDRLAPQMALVSPHGRLAGMKAHVYVLHGAGDTVIPATEAEWIARDLPPGALRGLLVTHALEHVDLKAPSLGDQWQLVHFMSAVVAEAEEEDGGAS